MCGRYLITDPTMIPFRFDADLDLTEDAQIRYNVAPSQKMPIIVRNSPNRAITASFGLIPVWADSPKTGYSMINARAETITSKSTFKKLISTKRCLVPASGYYEWRRLADKKVPYYFKLKDQDLFAFAGLYESYKDDKGQIINSYCIITCEPNAMAAEVHDRMPVILHKKDESKWLDKKITDPEKVLSLLKPYPASQMEARPISIWVNDPKHDSPDVLKTTVEKSERK